MFSKYYIYIYIFFFFFFFFFFFLFSPIFAQGNRKLEIVLQLRIGYVKLSCFSFIFRLDLLYASRYGKYVLHYLCNSWPSFVCFFVSSDFVRRATRCRWMSMTIWISTVLTTTAAREASPSSTCSTWSVIVVTVRVTRSWASNAGSVTVPTPRTHQSNSLKSSSATAPSRSATSSTSGRSIIISVSI